MKLNVTKDANETWKELQEDKTYGAFYLKTVNKAMEDASKLPDPCALFDVFWSEGEICILFGDTNTGKSALAVQIANSITTGKKIEGFQLGVPSKAVVYVDYELSDKQFQIRYTSKDSGLYLFDESFRRACICQECIMENYKSGTLEDFLGESMEEILDETEANVLIIDNITYLEKTTERAEYALPLMKYLGQLKHKYELSILVLAHTPKRDPSKEITRNDLQGSKMLINFADSAFCIGENWEDNRIRYFKQVKTRSTELVYDKNNVATCHLVKDDNFLQFQLTSLCSEADHLKRWTDEERKARKMKMMELKEQGFGYREISRQLGVHESTVRYHINKNEKS